MATPNRSAPAPATIPDSTPEGGAENATDRPRGSMIGRYVAIEPLGKGAMGAVFAAYDTQLDRRVALKLLRAARGEEPEEWRSRLVREALPAQIEPEGLPAQPSNLSSPER